MTVGIRLGSPVGNISQERKKTFTTVATNIAQTIVKQHVLFFL